MAEFSELAEQGDADAQYYLGLMYNSGEGILQDYATAVKWYELSAEQGFSGAQYNLGFAYATGEGVVNDMTLAYMWIRVYILNENTGRAQKASALPLLQDLQHAGMITASEASQGETLARECIANNYKNCGY